MAKSLFTLIVVALLTACQTAPPIGTGSLSRGELLDGTALIGHPVAAVPDAGAELFMRDDAMRAFVARWIPYDSTTGATAKRLLMGMQMEGLLNLEYDAQLTTVPRETFHSRSGNCLSFTLLFAALAEEAGLRVVLQLVDVPPDWRRSDTLLVSNRHVNVRLPDPRPNAIKRDVIIDFNQPDQADVWKTTTIRKRRLLALYHTNLAMEAFTRDDLEGAFAQLKTALAVDPLGANAWTDLGLLYARANRDEHALAAYGEALRAAPDDPSALANTAHLFERMGRSAEAAALVARLEDYRDQNPYWHSQRAHRALEDGRLEDAQRASQRAVALKDDDPRLYALRSEVLLRSGDPEGAIALLQQAAAVESRNGGAGAYADKLRRLNAYRPDRATGDG